MSVIEVDKIDAMGISKDGKGLILMLADHLDWIDEVNHLLMLQNKINSYLEYIESNQFLDIYPDVNFKYYVIEVHFKFQITNNCIKYIDVINKQLEIYKIKVVENVDATKGDIHDKTTDERD